MHEREVHGPEVDPPIAGEAPGSGEVTGGVRGPGSDPAPGGAEPPVVLPAVPPAVVVPPPAEQPTVAVPPPAVVVPPPDVPPTIAVPPPAVPPTIAVPPAVVVPTPDVVVPTPEVPPQENPPRVPPDADRVGPGGGGGGGPGQVGGAPPGNVVILKFKPVVTLPYEDNVGPLVPLSAGAWTDLENLYPGIRMERLHRSLPVARLAALRARALAASPGALVPDLFKYYRIVVPQTIDPEAVADTVRAGWPGVELAYVRYPAPDPGIVAADPLARYQAYLDAAPRGIDARCAWKLRAGAGDGQSLIDVERGWTLNHVDLAPLKIPLLGGRIVDSSRAHGTAALGIVCAVENGQLAIGIAPRLKSVQVVSYCDAGGWDEDVANAITLAADQLSAGDVLLVEAQGWADHSRGIAGPKELEPHEFETIQHVTLGGIVVIEPAGNGDGGDVSVDLDRHLVNRAFPFRRDASNTAFQDSGAIVVAAASAAAPHERLSWSSHGRRIDCYAWGEHVASACSDPSGTTNAVTVGFGGTSAAAAIVAGAAIVVQGLAQAHLGRRFTPAELRRILSDPNLGTAPAERDGGRIGVMPDLCKIARHVFRLTPGDEPARPERPTALQSEEACCDYETPGWTVHLLGWLLGAGILLLVGLVLGLVLGLLV